MRRVESVLSQAMIWIRKMNLFLEQIEKTGLTIQTARAPQARDIGHKQTVEGNHLFKTKLVEIVSNGLDG